MASLTTLFKNDVTIAQETDKLVDLFRNRAELKKEFAALRNEKYQLQDRIKHHQGATARVQQQLLHLENLLLDPEWVHNVVAFYQLRALAGHCNRQLLRFSEELKQQREQRALNKIIASWNERREKRLAEIESRMGGHRNDGQLLEDRLQSERHRLMTMNGFVKLFRGRSLAADIGNLESRIEDARQKERACVEERDAVETLAPPDQQGLDTAAKRSINFMILSFAQQLYLHYEDDDLVNLAKEASEKSVGAINYGGKRDCDAILEKLEKRKKEYDPDANLAEVLGQRARLIAKAAQFRHEDDAVPIPASVTTVFSIGSNGDVERRDANILGGNYFAIAKVLSR